MTEEEARAWINVRFGPAGEARMERLAAMIEYETLRQNLIAPSTVASLWSRHIVDSAQLLAFADDRAVRWLDIGPGAGFPGLVIALLSDHIVTLAEPRRQRAVFLERAVDELGLQTKAIVFPVKAERLPYREPYPIISARAVASIADILSASVACSSKNTRWILPKGKIARQEVAAARFTWQGTFHVEQSITDPSSLVVLATEVTRR